MQSLAMPYGPMVYGVRSSSHINKVIMDKDPYKELYDNCERGGGKGTGDEVYVHGLCIGR